MKGRKPGKNGIRPEDVTGSVTWSDSNGPLTCTESGSSTTTVTSGTPGTATCTTAALAVAPSDTITGAYSGDSNHSGGSGSVSQEIDAATTSVSVASSANPSTFGQSVTFTATLSGEYGLVKGRKAGRKPMDVTGAVTWSANTGCAASTVSGGTATCTTTSLPVGASDMVTATYAGDSNHGGGSGSVSQEVDAASGSASVGSSANPSSYGQSVTFTATITGANGNVKGRKPGNSVIRPMNVTGTVAWSDSNGPLTCTESGSSTTSVTGNYPGTATCTTADLAVASSDTVTGAYSGDGNHGAASGSGEPGNRCGDVERECRDQPESCDLWPSRSRPQRPSTVRTDSSKGRKPAGRNGVRPMDLTGSRDMERRHRMRHDGGNVGYFGSRRHVQPQPWAAERTP